MTYIESIQAREILDSRGNPTVEVEVVLEDRRACQHGHRRRSVRLGCHRPGGH
jgi:enolase